MANERAFLWLVFARNSLEFSVDPAKVKATFDKGVLKVHVPKPPEAKSETKKIAIKG